MSLSKLIGNNIADLHHTFRKLEDKEFDGFVLLACGRDIWMGILRFFVTLEISS